MEQQTLIFNDEEREKKNQTDTWIDWLVLHGFKNVGYEYYEYNIWEQNRVTCRICASLMNGRLYSFDFKLTQWCLTYTDSYVEGEEAEGGFSTIDSISNGIKLYLDLRDEMMEMKKSFD